MKVLLPPSLQAIADLLKQAPRSEQADEALRLLTYPDKLYECWTIDDVMSEADGLHIPISAGQCMSVLHHLQKTHDRGIGLNYKLVRAAIERVTS